MYQWTGFAWAERAPDSHADLYTRCFKDGLDVPGLTQDMGWFGAVFCRMLWAQQAFIEQLQTRLITLEAGGVIRSSNYSPGTTGFQLTHNGEAEFNNGTFRGVIRARDGDFTGNLNSGVFFSSNEERGENLPAKTFAATQTAKDVYDFYGGRPKAVSGSWGDTQGVISLNFRTDQIPSGGSGGLGGLTTRYHVDILLFNETSVTRSWASTAPYTLGLALVIDGGRRGPIFRLGLQTGRAGLQVGDVYRDDAGFIRVVRLEDV